MVQDDEAVGLGHRTEHTRALVACGFDLQAAIGLGGDDAALVFGAARFFADGFEAGGFYAVPVGFI